ncbi:MAG: glycosyltransferase family 2 protein [Proteobacteria bacterium]|nr:glycosyltransferase family 2 protein [Pseudomonadota bacterium]
MELSVVIPVMNEKGNIAPLLENISGALKGMTYEVIFVDDGSTDGTVEAILKLSGPNIRVLVFGRNYGQTSAMAAGIESATGEFVVTMDGDLQNDATDIPLMLKRLKNNNLDVVVGIRKKRKDGVFLRKIPSIVANVLIRKMVGINITDIGCTLKVFRNHLAKKLDLYGELHRFIPVLASMHGAKIDEIQVKHHSRKSGQSKYGISRVVKVLSDLMLMLFFIKYRQKPMHLFGTLGLTSLTTGVLLMVYLIAEKMVGNSIGNRPMFFISILCMLASIQFITTGFIAELLMRTYYGANQKKPYTISAEYKGSVRIG